MIKGMHELGVLIETLVKTSNLRAEEIECIILRG